MLCNTFFSIVLLFLLNKRVFYFKFKIIFNIYKNFSYYINKNLELADLLIEITFFI